MNLPKFLLFLLYLKITNVWGGNTGLFLYKKLNQSPFGAGFRSALTERRNVSYRSDNQIGKNRIVRPCSNTVTSSTRHAAIDKNKPDDVRDAGVPHRRIHPCAPGTGDDLLCSDVRIALCAQKLTQRSTNQQKLRTLPSATGNALDELSEDGEAILASSETRGGGGGVVMRPLMFWENMVCGAVSRSIAQTVMHPANTMKTILQSTRGAERPTLGQLMRPEQFRMLTRGAGANFLLSVPHGAVNFAVLEFVRGKLNQGAQAIPFLRDRLDSIGPAMDFTSSAISTICCSIVSTPQMMITDNIMAGNYPNLPSAAAGLYTDRGVLGFYSGWWPGLVGKIPSYALTWTFFQQLKRVRDMVSDRPAKNIENTAMGCMASTATVCIMIPMDTIKTRLVTQMSKKVVSGTPYKGIVDCAVRIAKEEGIRTFYRGLPPRLLSVVPMIGIQFGVYEAMKKVMLTQIAAPQQKKGSKKLKVEPDRYGPVEAMEEAAMEVAASPDNPYPAPHFLKNIVDKKRGFFQLQRR